MRRHRVTSAHVTRTCKFSNTFVTVNCAFLPRAREENRGRIDFTVAKRAAKSVSFEPRGNLSVSSLRIAGTTFSRPTRDREVSRAVARELIAEAAVMLLPVPLDAPLVRASIRTHVALELRLRVHALELFVSPQGPPHRVTLAADRAYVDPLARFGDPVVSLLIQRVDADVVSVRPFVWPRNS